MKVERKETGDRGPATGNGRCRLPVGARRAAPAFAICGAIVVAIVWRPPVARAFPGGSDGHNLRRAAAELLDLQVESSARLLDPLAQRYPEDSDVLYELALLRFHRGDYGGAVQAMSRALTIAPRASDIADRRALLALMTSTRDTTARFVETRSRDGRFVVRHAPGPDAVLVPYALDALSKADRAMTQELGVHIPGPIRLEVYPMPQSLARVSSLTVEEIERTGTIALCKWDRLMITSPRALVRGYPWMDTIAHEFVHLVLSRASRDRAPVWMQEGIAKFLERRWRGETPAAHVDPAVAGILDRAVRSDRLIPFDRLHPSIARLPSQDEAALAFAQVATFIDTYYGQHGADKLRSAISRIARGADARGALANAAGTSWGHLETSWRDALRARPRPAGDAPRNLGLRFRHGGGDVDESLEVEVERARRHLRLGDLLWERERPGAAAVEYTRAHDAAPGDPIVSSRLARAALAAGQPDRAIAALDSVLREHPDHGPAYAIRGAALLARGDASGARTSLREAIWINPFDPQPHCDLARASSSDDERRREQAACRALGVAHAGD